MIIGNKKWKGVMKYKEIIARCNPSQTHEELNDLLLALENIEINNVLEIGVHMAGSMRVWRDVLDPDILIGIDAQIHPDFRRMGVTRVDQSIYKVMGLSQSPDVVKKVKGLLNNEKLDFLFIDGSHYYEDVKRDFLLYKDLVRSGGVIAFHDVVLTGNETCAVYRFWNEIKEQYSGKTISYKDKIGEAATGCGYIIAE